MTFHLDAGLGPRGEPHQRQLLAHAREILQAGRTGTPHRHQQDIGFAKQRKTLQPLDLLKLVHADQKVQLPGKQCTRM